MCVLIRKEQKQQYRKLIYCCRDVFEKISQNSEKTNKAMKKDDSEDNNMEGGNWRISKDKIFPE